MYIVELGTTMEVDQSSSDNGCALDAKGFGATTSQKGGAALYSIQHTKK